jgi:transcriptional regulator with XRE-family HTH domain
MEKSSSGSENSQKFVSAFGESLRKAREDRNLSQRDLAVKAGVNRTSILRLESDERGPTLDVAVRLAGAMMLDPETELELYRSVLLPRSKSPEEPSTSLEPEISQPVRYPYGRPAPMKASHYPVQRSHATGPVLDTQVKRI